MRLRKKSLQLFWQKVEKSKGCWTWLACTNEAGYGMFGIRKGKIERAHRIMYSITFGKIPQGMFVCHKCDNRKCVNPKHLFLGTNDDNVRDMLNKGRNAPPPPMGGWNRYTYTEETLSLFGTKPDTEIAVSLGVSKHAISRERRRRGIPAFPCQTRFKSGTPHPRWHRGKE